MRLNIAQPHLVKFLLVSAISFFIGAIHGMLQVLPPIRAWLDSIGSPYGGPGHMIDPLAHAHMNLVGGVVILAMGTSYYLLPIFSGKSIYSLTAGESIAMVDHHRPVLFLHHTDRVWHSGRQCSAQQPRELPHIHHYYGPIVASSGITMATGFCIFLVNIILSLTSKTSSPPAP